MEQVFETLFAKALAEDTDKAIASSGGLGMPTRLHEQSHALGSLRAARMERQGPAASPTKKVTMQSAFKPIGAAPAQGQQKMASIACPHCQGGISKSYAVKALALLAKSEGLDLDAELEALLENDVEKGGPKGPTHYLGNKEDPTAGTSVSKKKILHSHRGRGDTGAQRHQTPTNPVTEVAKSLTLPVIVGEPQMVEYSYGMDSAIAEDIQKGLCHMPPARNLRAESEEATGVSTPE